MIWQTFDKQMSSLRLIQELQQALAKYVLFHHSMAATETAGLLRFCYARLRRRMEMSSRSRRSSAEWKEESDAR
jgi:hypothetical protein